MALLSSLSLSLLRDTPKGKAETKAALKSDSLSTPSRSAGRPAAAAGAASAVSSASGALAALFCADEKGAAESSSTVTVPKTVAKDASLRAPVPSAHSDAGIPPGGAVGAVGTEPIEDAANGAHEI
ncbi:unnamed protein product [Durusdinium trenchii]|uniref:Uncharacterized protein n=1 Tax=Durusdinium trenchii TaxID=1381693 RepID=A0ABP0MWD4_9DINO